MTIDTYIKQIKHHFDTGLSTEHSYRSDLQVYISSLVDNIDVTNEPKRVECGAPDYILCKKEIPIGYIEAKDVGANLDKIEKTEQIKRYLKGLDNLILTDYLEFRFYRYREEIKRVQIGKIENGKIKPLVNNFSVLEMHLKDFFGFQGETIKSSQRLAQMMAGKARMMEKVFLEYINKNENENFLSNQLKAFRKILIHDLETNTFADIYAQTIAYGLFAARLHDNAMEKFSRQKARDLIPRSNPFLRNLFDDISGAKLDHRLVWVIDDFCEIFKATHLDSILKDFGETTAEKDPFIHFYETFLAEYDPKLRKSRGVYYTPKPVVNFIVRAVDDILKNEFDLTKGLADISKSKIKRKIEDINSTQGKISKEEIEVHRVQILDPATGTGTFLAETVNQIREKFKGQDGAWPDYVGKHLLPRINGFEVLMASYAVCHLKIEMLLRQTGYKAKDENEQPRLNVFLTNSLEESYLDENQIEFSFMRWLTNEASEANRVKRNTPVMCVLGNPPYSGESQNKGGWIMDLMENYKKEPGSEEKLKEKNPKWLNDDYVKFLRLGEYFIDKNGEGMLAFINPHGFLDNPTFRGMRWHLLNTFDKIYIIDLHGNSRKKEVSPDGSKDENVFDIMQGVSINIFVKTGKKKEGELAQVFHYDLYGRREKKYEFLDRHFLSTVRFKKLPNIAPMYFMKPKNFALQKKYQRGFSLTELFPLYSVGVVTGKDSLYINQNKAILQDKIKSHYGEIDEHLIRKISYRPFDNRYLYNNIKLIERNRFRVMKNFLQGDNLGLVFNKPAQGGADYFTDIFITKNITDQSIFTAIKRSPHIATLYTYTETNGQQSLDSTKKKPNLKIDIVNQIAKNLDLTFTDEKETKKNTFAPIDILDYIYAILHSPNYRKKYEEFLKIDFPIVPYPKDKHIFWKLVKLGGELRQIHLLENPKVEEFITGYPRTGDNVVEKFVFKKGRVYINDTQYFENVPEVAWDFFIGGYQPAQKWLKDRKGQTLSSDDIFHYQKIVVALVETERVMGKVDEVIEVDI